MVNFFQLTSKALGFIKKLGAISEKNLTRSNINNIGGTVNVQQTVIQITQPQNKPLNPQILKELHKILDNNPHKLETVNLEKKNALLLASGKMDTNHLDFIQKILPSQDYALWFAGLILKKKFKEGDMAAVAQIKTDMMTIDPIRGKNIANLCNAGYLELEIIPTFSSLSGNQQMQDFLPYYEQLVTQTPTSVFINSKHSSMSLKNEVLAKIEFAKKYSAQSIRLYALSEKNVKLGKAIISELPEKTKNEKILYILETESRLEVAILVT